MMLGNGVIIDWKMKFLQAVIENFQDYKKPSITEGRPVENFHISW